jgi:hypothetical protein
MPALPRSKRRRPGILRNLCGELSICLFQDAESYQFSSAYESVLKKDQQLHGSQDYMLEDDVLDEFQQEVDDVIEASQRDAATSSITTSTSAANNGE